LQLLQFGQIPGTGDLERLSQMGERMPFRQGQDVFIISLIDTGEIAEVRYPMYDVNRDTTNSIGEHHEADLKALPYRGRIRKEGFYFVIEALAGGGQRNGKYRVYTNTGSRIR
jgi:hypothetical protein